MERRKPCLLLADSNRDRRDLHRRFLSYQGYDVETATDGLSCVEKLRHVQPDLLVLHLELPWGGGCGVLARMREEPNLPAVPVILIVSAGTVSDAWHSSPVTACLSNPFVLGELADAVKSAGQKPICV